MFDNERYTTRGIVEEIPLEIQLLIWGYIDQLKSTSITVDYLQVFEFDVQTKDGYTATHLTHRQEQPPYKKQYALPELNLTSSYFKIWVIDDGGCSTMLLPEEY